MQIRTVLLLIVLAAIAIFAAVNWSAFVTPTPLSLVVTTVQAPLGLVMLALTALLTVMFLVFVVYLQSSVLFESRRYARELQAQRQLADQAEASRFTELRSFIETELRTHAGGSGDSKADLLARLGQTEDRLRAAIEQSGNTLAAYIGELEDRLERDGQASTPTRLS
ncbi:MAG: LapA family protein [Betaproteobacteria bacterium]